MPPPASPVPSTAISSGPLSQSQPLSEPQPRAVTSGPACLPACLSARLPVCLSACLFFSVCVQPVYLHTPPYMLYMFTAQSQQQLALSVIHTHRDKGVTLTCYLS